ncbi:MAG: T9SS type A sorting domain-containing protein [Ignavibacteria bacterium]|nr:T9SS type A sorting domain-containing protein [Ignavibacteria bacterium]
MKKIIFISILFLTFIYFTNAQLTYPTPFDLSTGNYSFTEWSATNPAGTYPTSMIFHRTSTQDPLLLTEMTTNYTGAYNLTSGSRINGLGTDGVSFVNTSTAGNIGAAVLALNTTNRTNIQLTWTGGFWRIAGTTTREYRIRVQYRIGDVGNFTDLTDQNGNPIEYIYTEYIGHPNPTTLPPHSTTFTVTLPASLEDQPVVYLRWKYYFVGTGSGNRPELRIDNIYVTSESSIGGGTRLQISNITPQFPLSNVPFSLTVTSVDNNGIAKKVSVATNVRLSLISGNGNLVGTLTKQIPYKATNVVFDDLVYNLSETITVRAEVISGELLSSTQTNIQVLPGPVGIVIEDLYTKLHINSPVPNFKVRAINSDNTTNTNYHNYQAKINFNGPTNFFVTANFVNGVATVTNVTFSTSGTYSASASSPGFNTSNTVVVNVRPLPTFTEVFVPKFLKGVGTFGTRIPTFALVRLENLHPNTVYRFFSGGRNVGYTGNVETDNGAGNNFHYNHQNNRYLYNSQRDLTQDNAYSTFESNNDGTKLIWLTLVPTTNASFNEGQRVYWILVLGTEKGTVIKRYQTTNTSVALDFGNPPTKCTGIYDEDSWLPPKSFVCLFDEQTGGNPVTVAIVQNENAVLQEGTDAQGNPFPPQGPNYYNNLDGVDGSWATIIPNNLSNGIRRLEVYDRNGNLLRRIYDLDGVWAGVNTKNVFGGIDNPISFKTPNIKIINPEEGSTKEICNSGSYEIKWISRGVQKIDIDISKDRGRTFFNIFEDIPANNGSVEWRIPRGLFADTTNRIRIYDREHPTNLDPRQYVSSETGDFYIYDKPKVSSHTQSAIACRGEQVILTTYATGSKLGYQWYKDGKKIEGAKSQQLILNNVDFTTSGIYYCEVTGASVCESDFTDKILVYILTKTKITKEPTDYYGYLGSTATFTFDVHTYEEVPSGVVPIQWYKNGKPLRDDWKYSGTRSNYFTIKNISYSDTSDYFYAIVNGRCGIDTTAIVKVHIVPNILIKADTLYVCDEDSYLSIPIEIPFPSLPGNYIVEVYRGNIMIGSYSPSVVGINIKLPVVSIIPGDYYAIVKVPGIGGSFKTNIVKVVKVTEPPVIKKDLPNAISLKIGDTLRLSIVAEGLNLRYQWFKDNSPLASAIEPNLLITNVSVEDAGRYHCLVWNCDTVSSNIVNVSVTLFNVSSVDWNTMTDGTKFRLYPNPTTHISELFIETNEEKILNIELINNLGQIVYSINNINTINNQVKVSIPFNSLNLPSGTYNLKIQTQNQIKVVPAVYLR